MDRRLLFPCRGARAASFLPDLYHYIYGAVRSALPCPKGATAMRIETSRLILRDMTQDDYPSLHAILTDPETMQHYPKPYDDAGVQR